ARFLRHPEHALCAVLVWILGVGAVVLLRDKLRVAILECIGDVLEEDQAEDNVLVLSGVHVVAELVGCLPQRALEAEVTSATGRVPILCLARLCTARLLSGVLLLVC